MIQKYGFWVGTLDGWFCLAHTKPADFALGLYQRIV
jgi:hypothetical protein